ncbi:integrase catalytic domain-containing protein [Treponema primitia]|uniref:integrase catalytic domain-containing protein n=1 Tax=Treponema primitia TaxID=88058 RepID=UPI000315B510|nr:DDE-type integrase/transposase/recombinase [Treponema primitia]
MFCLTPTATDVASGWTFLFPLRNKAHQWVISWLQFILDHSPFPVSEIHSDNGSEFINRDNVNLAKTAWNHVNVLLTRSRAHHSNDNCFTEQKNNAFVRNYVGFARYDTDKGYNVLGRIYAYRCPLLNFFVPNKNCLAN